MSAVEVFSLAKQAQHRGKMPRKQNEKEGNMGQTPMLPIRGMDQGLEPVQGFGG